MPEEQRHLSQEDLERYALGTLDAGLVNSLEQHFESCDDCFVAAMVYREMRDMEKLGLLPDPGSLKLNIPSEAGSKSAEKGGIAATIVGALGGIFTGLGIHGGLSHQHSPSLAQDADSHHPFDQQGHAPDTTHTNFSDDSVRNWDHHPSSVGEGADHSEPGHQPHQGATEKMSFASSSFSDAPTSFGLPATEGASEAVHQTYPDTCAVQCQRLILNQFGIAVTEDGLRQEAMERGLYAPGHGTSLEDVGKLMESHGVSVHREMNASVINLAIELAQGHKVIVGVDGGELWQQNSVIQSLADKLGFGDANHAVIVSGIDTTDPDHVKVVVTDPGTGDVAKEYPIAEFLDAWRTSHFSMVATSQPAPEWRPEMVNFDYHAGHIPSIGAAPYELAHELSTAASHETDPGVLDRLESLFSSVMAGGSAAENALTEFTMLSGHEHTSLQDMVSGMLAHIHDAGGHHPETPDPLASPVHHPDSPGHAAHDPADPHDPLHLDLEHHELDHHADEDHNHGDDPNSHHPGDF